jgi:hypothetical protein
VVQTDVNMAVRITGIRQAPGTHENPHLGILAFAWILDETQQTGITDLSIMYDWIVNRNGRAFIRDASGAPIYVHGAVSPSGKPYLRTVNNQQWTNDLLNLPSI